MREGEREEYFFLLVKFNSIYIYIVCVYRGWGDLMRMQKSQPAARAEELNYISFAMFG